MSRSDRWYDLFISYNHGADSTTAEALQTDLQRFARPWWALRSLRVFRDQTDMAAGVELDDTAQAALSRSDWFLLLASPESANSRWVRHEVQWWLRNRDPSRLLVAWTSGTINWVGRDFAPSSTALPRDLYGVFTRERVLVDLSTTPIVDGRPRFDRQRLAMILAPVRERPMASLLDDDRKRARQRVASFTAMAVAVVLAATATGFIWHNRRTTLAAERIATEAQRLSAAAQAQLPTRLDLAGLLAVEAYRLRPGDPRIQSTLFQVISASRSLRRFLPTGAEVSAVAGSADGSVAVAGLRDGRLLAWDAAGNRIGATDTGDRQISQVVVANDGKTVVAVAGRDVVVWHPQGASQQRIRGSSAVGAVGLSASQRRVAVAWVVSDTNTVLTINDAATGKEIRRGPINGFTLRRLRFVDDDTVRACGGFRRVVTYGGTNLSQIAAYTPEMLFPWVSRLGQESYSAGCEFHGFSINGSVTVTATAATKSAETAHADTGVADELATAVSSDGKLVAVPSADGIHVAGIGEQGAAPYGLTASSELLSGVPGASALEFYGGSRRLISAFGTTVVLWDLEQPGRLAQTTAGFSFSWNRRQSMSAPDVAVSDNGRFAAISGEDKDVLVGSRTTLVDLTTGRAVDSTTALARPDWVSSNGHLVLGVDTEYDPALWRPGGAVTTAGAWERPAGSAFPFGAMQADSSERSLTVLGPRGQIEERRVDGTRIRVWRNGSNESSSYDAAAVAADRSSVAQVVDGRIQWTALRSPLSTITLTGPEPDSLWFTAGGDLAASRRDGSLIIYSRRTGQAVRTLPVGPAQYTIAGGRALDRGGRWFARVTTSGGVEIVDADSGYLLGGFPLPMRGEPGKHSPASAQRTTVVSRPGTSELLTLSADGYLTRWNLARQSWSAIVCRVAGRQLTSAEWTTVTGHDVPAEGLACPQGR
ncbi:toll/interleukin-1 receptor domain-containing protein [Cryptosporangium arvum]|uniref:TIR-like domain-containing protein (DUF1863) n=1 Tax=Cryptosporangium arvum DSM 44712 TaxID=927661 RepID=A0A011AJT0_9ACTN|nr:toll/interleukin-1 receptor domain-containing protein [Cryptosporangium arvum]EXG82241.1 TIR-like domain-containing protein (DUF1863) [Cryptosporangium arvum DSM 44712]